MSQEIRPPMEGSQETWKMTLFSIPNSPGNSSPNRKETQERRRMVPFAIKCSTEIAVFQARESPRKFIPNWKETHESWKVVPFSILVQTEAEIAPPCRTS